MSEHETTEAAPLPTNDPHLELSNKELLPAKNSDNSILEATKADADETRSLPANEDDKSPLESPAIEGGVADIGEVIQRSDSHDDTNLSNPHVNENKETLPECSAKEEAELTEETSVNNCPVKTVESLNEATVCKEKEETIPQPVIKKSQLVSENNTSSSGNEKKDENPLEPIKEPVVASPSSEVSTANDQNVLQDPSTESAAEVLKNSSKETEESSKESETTQSGDEYAEHVTYTDDGIAIYTDPKTQFKYKWCEVKNNWISFAEETNSIANGDGSQKSNPYENEHYRWCTETSQWIPKTTAPTSNQTETEHYRWDAEKNEWILKSQISLDNVTYGFEDGVRTYTDKDGAVFFWDTEKKAWFPKIDDDFMARYQMNYGFIDNTSVAATEEVVKKEEPVQVDVVKKVDVPVGGVKRKAAPEPPKWFELDPTQNTKVYVSNLPLDITIDEFAEIMSKCGMIMRDPATQKQKLKLYTEADGQIKGDGLCDYIKVESVDLALKLLDESYVRGNKIKVQRAKFQMRGEYNPTLKPKRKKKDKEKLLKMKEKLFDWRPEKMRGERSKHEKIVIIKNLFTPELFDKEVQLIIEYQNDLREECSKCGTVRKVVVYDRHADGVAQVNMADPDQADLVVQMMNGRYFGKRKLIAEIWDGKTKYKIAETEKEVQERISKWDKYLETGEEKSEKEQARLTVSSTTDTDSDEAKDIVDNASPV